MGIERRGRRRVAVEARRLELSLAWRGVAIRGAVRDLSQRGLQVELPAAGAPAEGDAVDEGVLQVGDEAWARVGPLRVADVRAGAGGGVTARLLIDDEGSRAALWGVMARLAHTPRAEAATPLPRIPARGKGTEAGRRERVAFLRERTGADLAGLEPPLLAAEDVSSMVEAFVGAVGTPVGIAGPLLLQGRHARGLSYLPLACSDWGLVASTTRGAKALSLAGGVTARVVRRQITRAPVFVMEGAAEARRLARWIRDHQDEARVRMRATWPEGDLTLMDPIPTGRLVHVTLGFETADVGADGSEACARVAGELLMDVARRHLGIGVRHFRIEGHTGGERKVSYRSFLSGRGIRVVAEALLPPEVVRDVLRVAPEQLLNAGAACAQASVRAGMVGHSLNVPSLLAAAFLATGQDLGCVHESSLAQLHVHADRGQVYASLVLPSLVMSPLGPAAHLPAQRSLLRLCGAGTGADLERLAETVAAFALALEVSTLAAVAALEDAPPGAAVSRRGRRRAASGDATGGGAR